VERELFDSGRAWILATAGELGLECGLTARWRPPDEEGRTSILELLRGEDALGELSFDPEREVTRCAGHGEETAHAREAVRVRIYRELVRIADWEDPRTGAF
jgi:hypothetical protein